MAVASAAAVRSANRAGKRPAPSHAGAPGPERFGRCSRPFFRSFALSRYRADEFRQACDSSCAQFCRVARNRRFARAFDAGHAAVDRRNQLLELVRELTHFHRHPLPRLGADSRRAAFQTSPQPSHRQYALSSDRRAVVVMDCDRHAGHALGGVTGSDAGDAEDRYAPVYR